MNTQPPAQPSPARAPLAFIDIRRKSRSDEDRSSLAVAGRTTPGYVSVIGGLPHCVEIAPATEAARLAWIAWLESEECKTVARRAQS